MKACMLHSTEIADPQNTKIWTTFAIEVLSFTTNHESTDHKTWATFAMDVLSTKGRAPILRGRR